MKKCSPHQWIVPEIGDDGIVCKACGRWMDFINDFAQAPYKAHAIVKSMKKRELEHADEFINNFKFAYDDARIRFQIIHRRHYARLNLPS